MVRIILGMQIDYTDKNPGLRVIKVREMLLHITAKIVASFPREHIIASVGSLKVSAEKKCRFSRSIRSNAFHQDKRTEAASRQCFQYKISKPFSLKYCCCLFSNAYIHLQLQGFNFGPVSS